MTAVMETMMMLRRSLAIAALLPLAGCMGDNFGLESIHQPVVSATKAEVPGCPDWSSQKKNSTNITDANYGCSINSNLAAMIADPQDLLRGRSAPPSTEGHIRAIKSWRETAPTGKQQTVTTATAPGGK
jgi:type IV pilus biogenesis protein CpaD/CtpE